MLLRTTRRAALFALLISSIFRSAIMEVGKELGRKVLTGSFSLINLSVPVKMFEPRSYLQKLADVWVYPR